MNKIKQLLLAVSIFAIASTANAALIEGAIGFGGSYDHNGSDINSLLDATAITNINGVVLGNVTGDFAANGISEFDSATFSDITFDPTGPVSALWSVGDFTFNLTSMSLDEQTSSTITLSGEGMITSTIIGLSDTAGSWTFTANVEGIDPNINFTWSSSSAAVPEPAVALLLATGLIGFGFTRRKQKTT